MTNPLSSPRRLLIVEDNFDLWFIIRQAIYQVNSNLETHHVASAHDALSYLRQTAPTHAPDLILQDLCIPNREDGLSLLRSVKDKSNPTHKIPVIIMSSSNTPANIDQAYALGCNSFIEKPAIMSAWIKVLRDLQAYWLGMVALPTLK